jgi:hypothetical protein
MSKDETIRLLFEQRNVDATTTFFLTFGCGLFIFKQVQNGDGGDDH